MRVALPLLLAGIAGRAWALPDLVPEVDDVSVESGQTVSSGDVAEGCAGATRDRTLVRFGVRFWNRGTDTLVVGTPDCPDCEENPGAVCGDPRFICSPADGHGHPHYDDFAKYELLDPAGTVVATGFKASFCIRESGCAVGEPSGDFSCEGLQGIGVECFDYYRSSLGCQYIDVTDVPNAARRAFRIRVTLDPNGQLPDADRSNNPTEFEIDGCGDGQVDAGEDCDQGTAAEEPCCGADCRFLDDGASCGAGVPPCFAERCETGVCTPELATDFCLIDAACVSDGTADDSGCRACTPAERTDDWTDISTADAPGLRCQLRRIADVLVGGCTPKTTRQMERRVVRLELLLQRVALNGRPADLARFARRARKLQRFATLRGCATEEASALLTQTNAFVAARVAGAP